MDEIKKVSVDSFITEYEEAMKSDNPDDKNQVIKNIIDTHYVPFIIKLNIAQKLVSKYNFKENDIYSQTAMMYLAFTSSVLRLYTKMEISSSNTDIDYDKLQQHGIVNKLFLYIGDDLKEYQEIFNMCMQDFNANYLSVPSFVQRQLNKMMNYFGKYTDEFIKWLDSIDESKIIKSLKELS